jgi:hypothetical protein
LTGTEGEFIASHLIPKALTRPSTRGLPLVQIASGKKPLRRWDSWYDDRLVTLQGEQLLTELDTWAIRHMRAHRLVWSGWGNAASLSGHFEPLIGSQWGIRKITGLNTLRLRLFFLSLLWRAGATELPEFREVEVPASDLEALRTMLLTGRAEPIGFYWMTLTQLSTRGEVQNMPPIAQYKDVRSAVPGMPHRLMKIFRFYFDGLIVHIRLPETGMGTSDNFGRMVVGASDELVVSTVTYEGSFQKENLDWVRAESLPSNLI